MSALRTFVALICEVGQQAINVKIDTRPHQEIVATTA